MLPTRQKRVEEDAGRFTLTLALLTGMSVRTVSAKVVANLGWDKVKATHPVFAGDTLYAESTCCRSASRRAGPRRGSSPFPLEGKSRWQRSDELRAHHADLQARPLARSCRELLRRRNDGLRNQYKAKLTDSHGAVEQIGSNSIVAIGQAVCQPPALMEALASARKLGISTT
jgi:hypothetical protein